MNILGISGLLDVEQFLNKQFPREPGELPRMLQGMDAAAALIVNGTLIAAASQERFDRQKKSPAFPFQAIDYCLDEAGIEASDLNAICGNFSFGRSRQVFAMGPSAKKYWEACLDPKVIAKRLCDSYQIDVPFVPTDHHDCHLHSALVSAPFEDCLAIVMDAAGEMGSTTVYEVNSGRVKRLRRYSISQSLGILYTLVTQFLGYAPNEDEYKIMGLASFGDPGPFREAFQSLLVLEPGGQISVPCLSLRSDFADGLFFRSAAKAIREAAGFDGASAEFRERADFSAALQERFTQALFHIAEYFRDKVASSSLLLSGGCAENCAAIGELRRAQVFDAIHVGYASGDEGTALGAAAAQSMLLDEPLRLPHGMPFFGYAPSKMIAAPLAHASGLKVEAFDCDLAMIDAAGDDIAADRVVAIVNGRMEYGARALGNRSLLALPGNAANKDRINGIIKKRQNYRPFAPAVIAEAANIYFDLDPSERYPYMTMLTTVRPEYRSALPAITHVDGTARVQTVDRADNPQLFRLLERLGTRTGIPVVLNTSFNVNHQPIVCNEREAIETFIEMGIDALYIAGLRITL